jgi:hypothetical protein
VSFAPGHTISLLHFSCLRDATRTNSDGHPFQSFYPVTVKMQLPERPSSHLRIASTSSNIIMSDKHTKRPWSLRRKVLVGGIIALIVLGLALGLGLGFGLGGGNGDDNDNQPPTSTLTPLPSPNNTLPWTPKVNDTWQIILSHPPLLAEADTATTPNVSIFDIDLFDTPTETITKLHKLGKKVICYFSAGSYEDWRPDAKNFTDADKGKQLDGWPGEKWLKLSSSNVRAIMKKRIELAGRKGCDGVDPDNIDGYVRHRFPFCICVDDDTDKGIREMQMASVLHRKIQLRIYSISHPSQDL